jgi:hypothetical protein
MTPVRRIVRRARWRLMLNDALLVLSWVLTGALVLIGAMRLVERAFGLGEQFDAVWPRVAVWGPVLVAVITLFATLVRRRREFSAARELDERAGLKETLSTALAIERESDPWCRVVVEEAQRVAAGVQVRRAIPLEAPRPWPVPVFTALAVALAWFAMPKLDLLGREKRRAEENRRQEGAQAVVSDLRDREEAINKLIERGKIQMIDEPAEVGASERKAEENDPEAIRRALVRKLTVLTEKLQQERSGEKAAQAQAIRDAMRQLRQPGQGPLNEFSRMLARGDFGKAQEMLKQFQEQMAEGEMSPEAREQARQQLENLARQLEKLAQEQRDLQKKLEEQGLDRKTAQEVAKKAASGDPEDLKKALEQMQNMSDAQKQRVLELAKASMQCQGMCQNMGLALARAAQGLTQEGLQQEGMEGLEAAMESLSEMETLQADMENLDAALEEAKRQLADLAGQCLGGECEGDGQGLRAGNSPFREGTRRNIGMGSGGPGRGHGPGPEGEPVEYTTDKVKANVKTRAGPIIGSRLVHGDQVRGESVAEFQEVVASSSMQAAEALEGQTVPREYHDAVKTYFGRLQEKVKKDRGEPAGGGEPK